MQSSKLALPNMPVIGVTKEGRLCNVYRDGHVCVQRPTNQLARIAMPVLENIFYKKR